MTTATPKAANEGKEGPAIRDHGADGARGLRVLTGVLLILTPVAFNAFFTLLSVTFGYPDILREPTGHVLRRFDAGGGGLVAIWYGFMLTAVLFVPLAVTYLDPASSGATRESAAVVFQAFNQYAGVGVGENLGYLFTGAWTALIALAMLGSALPFRRWLTLLGAVAAAGIAVGMLEPAGFDPAADMVVAGYILWSVWLALFGVLLLLPGSVRHRARPVYPAGKATTRIEGVAGGDRGR